MADGNVAPEYLELVSDFASLVELKAPEFQDDGICAYRLPDGGHFEIAPSQDQQAVLMFCEVRREDSSDPAEWRRWLELSLELANSHGVFLVCDSRDGMIYLTRHLILAGATPEQMGRAAEGLLTARKKLTGAAQNSEQDGSGDGFEPGLAGRLV